jgi:hypothetical protein
MTHDVPTSTSSYFAVSKPKYRCPAHGVIEHTISVAGVRPDLDGDYCIVCWLLLMERSGVHRVTKIDQ